MKIRRRNHRAVLSALLLMAVLFSGCMFKEDRQWSAKGQHWEVSEFELHLAHNRYNAGGGRLRWISAEPRPQEIIVVSLVRLGDYTVTLMTEELTAFSGEILINHTNGGALGENPSYPRMRDVDEVYLTVRWKMPGEAALTEETIVLYQKEP